MNAEELKDFQALLVNKLYPAIEIQTDNGLVGFVHAEVPEGIDWSTLKSRLNNRDIPLLSEAIWNREIALKAMYSDNKDIYLKDSYTIPDLLHVFHGHSINNKTYDPYSIGNRFYIDTGAYSSNLKSKMTIFDINNPHEPIATSSLHF